MKKFTLISAVALCLVFISSISWAQESKNFPIKSVKGVSVSSGIDLYLTHGNSEALQIKTSEANLKELEVLNENGTLIIRFKDQNRWNFVSRGPVKAYLTYQNLEAVRASGGSDVFTQNTLETANLSLIASGGSDLSMKINCKNLSVRVSGGSDAALSGKSDNMDAQISGGSDLKAFNLLTVNARVSASGGADADLSVSTALEASASGGADIRYKGNPSVKKNNSKSGSVRMAN